jgi:anthranilate synthase component 1
MAELLLDTETPVSAFQKLALSGPAFLLESIEGGEKWGRYSLLAAGARIRFEVRGRTVTIDDGGPSRSLVTDEPLAALKELLASHRPAELAGVPRFAGGAVGYLGYDLVRRFERLPELAVDDLGLPDAQLMIADTAVVFDNLSHTVKVVHNTLIGDDPRADYARAASALERTVALLAGPDRMPFTHTPLPASGEPAMATGAGGGDGGGGDGSDVSYSSDVGDFRSVMGESRYLSGVERIRDLIHAGEAVQVVLSHRLSRPFAGHPFDTYRALRVINPSPYMFYLDFGALKVAGASPEVLVRVEGDELTVRPIAGTRPRGASEAEDREFEAGLRADAKELAEHLMLVDLGRNDLGRVADFGTVTVEDSHLVERYSHVMHLVSAVRGRLRPGLDCFDALRACFPAGTVSGAPKVRAMEIIEELEPTRRGIYAGAIGYIDFQGNLDTAIAIRTLVFLDGQAHLQVGAGIVADSVPAREFEETMAKARAMCRAVEMADRGLTLAPGERRAAPATDGRVEAE